MSKFPKDKLFYQLHNVITNDKWSFKDKTPLREHDIRRFDIPFSKVKEVLNEPKIEIKPKVIVEIKEGKSLFEYDIYENDVYEKKLKELRSLWAKLNYLPDFLTNTSIANIGYEYNWELF